MVVWKRPSYSTQSRAGELLDDYKQLANLWARVEEKPHKQEPVPIETSEKKMLSQLIDLMRRKEADYRRSHSWEVRDPAGMPVDADPAYVNGYMDV